MCYYNLERYQNALMSGPHHKPIKIRISRGRMQILIYFEGSSDDADLYILNTVNLKVHNFQVITISFQNLYWLFQGYFLISVQPNHHEVAYVKMRKKIANYTGSAPMCTVLDLISSVLGARQSYSNWESMVFLGLQDFRTHDCFKTYPKW